MTASWRDYYLLVKPGIIKGNLLSTIAGFALISGKNIDFSVFFGIVLGTSLVIASGCVFNNIIDRDIDALMKRTKTRALVTGKISVSRALIFGTILLLLGILDLVFFTNVVTLLVGLTGWVFYVVIYSMFTKRSSVFGTLIGSISGAVPPVAGYTAVSGSLDITATILFATLVFWQMPHFYAIALYGKKDYESASIPVLSVVRGLQNTRQQIIFYIFGFYLCAIALFFNKSVGITFLTVMSILCAWWITVSLKKISESNYVQWGHKIFGISLSLLLSWSILLMANFVLP